MWAIQADFDRNNQFAYNLTDYITRFKSWLGMRDAYQLMADESTLLLTLDNSSGAFNPENIASPYYGKLRPQTRIRVVAQRDSGDQILWMGWLQRVTPDHDPAGASTGKTQVALHCVGSKMLLDGVTVDLGVYNNITGDQIVADVLREAVIPPAMPGAWLAEITGSSEAGVTTIAGDASAYSLLETGRTTFQTLLHDRHSNLKGYDAIRLVTESERGHFFFNRSGQAVWWNRHHLLSTTTPIAVVNLSGSYRPVAIDYDYSADTIKNIVRVGIVQRSTAALDTLWSLKHTITIPPTSTIRFDVMLRDKDGETIGASSLSAVNVNFSNGSATITLSSAGSRVGVTLENTGSTAATLTTLDIQGIPIQDRNRMSGIASDATSIGLYGRRELDLALRALETLEQAMNVAQFELLRRKDARGMVRSLDFLNVADGSANAHQLDWTIGTRLTVTLTNGHSADYFIIGEQHEVMLPGINRIHRTRFYLEPALASRFWMAGVPGYSEAGQTTYGGY